MSEVTDLLKQLAAAMEREERSRPEPSKDVETAWVEQWGEVVNKKTACKMLGCCYNTIYTLVESGAIQAASDGRIITLTAARYFCQPDKKRKKQSKYRLIV